MGKLFAGYPADNAPTTTDSVPTKDAETGLNKTATLASLITLFFNNIPTGAVSPVTRGAETIFDHVASGGVITGDSVGVNRNASMTAMICYINGRRISISAVSARTYTASKDTYVDVLDNLDGTGTLVYTEATNNAASPALAANSIRIGIVVTGATTIAAAGSVNQGQQDRVLPIASSIPYAVTDSLGNLICPRDPNRRILGYRQITSDFTSTTAGSLFDITGLACPVIIPTGRRIEVSIAGSFFKSSQSTGSQVSLAAIEDSTLIGFATFTTTTSSYTQIPNLLALRTPAAGSHTYKAQGKQDSAGTFTLGVSGAQACIVVRLM